MLRLAPGLDVARIDSDHWSVGVRGFGDQFSKSVLVLIDGRSVYTPLFAGVFWGVQDVLLQDIERIEVIRGPGGTIWGANAVNGIINIISKRARDTHGTMASAGGGTLDHAIGGVRVGGGNGSSLDYRVKRMVSHADPSSMSMAPISTRGTSARRASASIGGAAATASRCRATRIPGGTARACRLGTYRRRPRRPHYEPLDVSGAEPGRAVAPRSGSRQRRAGPGVLRSDLSARPAARRVTPHVRRRFIHHIATARRQDVIWGLGARVSPSHVIETVPTLVLTPADATEHIYSAFVQDDVMLVDQRVWLTLGSKLERNDYTGGELQPSVRVLWAPSTRAVDLDGRFARRPHALASGEQSAADRIPGGGPTDLREDRRRLRVRLGAAGRVRSGHPARDHAGPAGRHLDLPQPVHRPRELRNSLGRAWSSRRRLRT